MIERREHDCDGHPEGDGWCRRGWDETGVWHEGTTSPEP